MIKMSLAGGAIAATALLLTACSSRSGTSVGTSSATTSAAAGAGSSAAADMTTSPAGSGRSAGIGTASGVSGRYLVDANGKAIYILTSDKPGGPSPCTTACLKFWPPVAAPSPLPSAVTGVKATFGSTQAADGTNELTIDGYPAYTFSKDTGPGTTDGQGIVSFGGTWWLVSPSGSFITAATGSASPPSSSSAGAYSAY